MRSEGYSSCSVCLSVCLSISHSHNRLRGYGEPFVSKILIDRSIRRPNRSIDAYITVRMRISSVFLNMRIIIRILEPCYWKNAGCLFTYIPRGDFSKMVSNQALPGPSTSGFSSPSESPWEVQQKAKARFPQLFAGWCSAWPSKRSSS